MSERIYRTELKDKIRKSRTQAELEEATQNEEKWLKKKETLESQLEVSVSN